MSRLGACGAFGTRFCGSPGTSKVPTFGTVMLEPPSQSSRITCCDVAGAPAPRSIVTVALKSPLELPPGKATLRFEFAYDGGGPAKGGMGTLFVNGEKVAEGRIDETQAGMFSADETADVGIDLGTPVVETMGAEAASRFNGRIPKVTVEIPAGKPGTAATVSSK